MCISAYKSLQGWGSGPQKPPHAPESDLMQGTEIYKIGLQWLPTVKCRRVQKVCVCTGDLKHPAKGLEPTALSCTSPHQDPQWNPKASAPGGFLRKGQC